MYTYCRVAILKRISISWGPCCRANVTCNQITATTLSTLIATPGPQARLLSKFNKKKILPKVPLRCTAATLTKINKKYKKITRIIIITIIIIIKFTVARHEREIFKFTKKKKNYKVHKNRQFELISTRESRTNLHNEYCVWIVCASYSAVGISDFQSFLFFKWIFGALENVGDERQQMATLETLDGSSPVATFVAAKALGQCFDSFAAIALSQSQFIPSYSLIQQTPRQDSLPILTKLWIYKIRRLIV